MPINPAIALGVQSPQFESPMNMMAQMMQIKGAQEASQLNALKFQQAQREVEQQNMLSQAYQSAFDPEKGTINYNKLTSQLASSGAGAQIPGILKGQREADAAELTRQKVQTDLVDAKLKQSRSLLESVRTPEEYMAWHQANHSDPILGKVLASRGITAEQSVARIQQAIQQGPEAFQQLLNQSKLGTEKFMEMNKPVVVSPGGSVWTGKEFKTAPAAPEKPAAPPASIAEYERARNDPQFMRFLQERAIAMRPPRPEPAPRTQQITLSDGSLGIVNMDTGVITPSTLAGASVKGKPSATEEKAAVSEQQAAYNIGRVLTAANQIKEIGKEDPNSAKPGLTEALASSIGMGGTANLARNANRQIVQGAQRDALDALLYLATGAAYNKEQLQGQMDAYIPAFTDKPETVAAKKARMANLIQSAKVRAGKAWTPEMDRAMTALTGSDAPPAVVRGRSGGPAVADKPGGNLSAAEQAELEQLRKRFGK